MAAWQDTGREAGGAVQGLRKYNIEEEYWNKSPHSRYERRTGGHHQLMVELLISDTSERSDNRNVYNGKTSAYIR